MKKILVAMFALLVCAVSVNAQDAKEIAKERKAIAKLSSSELNAKASKDARKAGKEYERDGWIVAPGHLPIEKQLDKAYKMQYEYDEFAFPKYIMAEAMSIGENYDAAKMQALELAKLNLAGQVQTEVTALVESSVANQQLGQGEAASITETVMASKNLISQSIGRIIPVVEVYRDTRGKNKEVRVMVAYNSKMALEAAKNAVRAELEKKSEKLHEQLDKVLGFGQ